MSLHNLAQHLQSAGRGEDKVLVHMTPGEVSGLQSLAMAHGGSLTINPETGLPEARFLRAILPLVAGLALGPAGLGLSALNAGLLVGAAGTAATGSLGKGLMMGLGAYGGAGLGAGLSSMGTTANAATTTGATTGVTTGTTTGAAGATNVFSPTVANAQSSTLGNAVSGKGAFPSFVPAETGLAGANVAAPTVPLTSNALAFKPGYVPPAPSFASVAPGQNISTLGNIGAGITPEPSMMSNLGAGFKQATGTGMQGLKDLYAASEAAAPYGLAAGVGSLALNKYFDRDKPEPPKPHPGMIRPYNYERTQRPESYDMGAPMYAGEPGSSAEKNYFNESYTELTPYRAPGPEYAAEGGIMGYAVGGPIEQMAALNAVGANTGYPQAGINTPMYANPMMQRPEAVNVLAPSSDAGVGAYSGEPKFAGGGETVKVAPKGYQSVGQYDYNYDPKTMQFTQTGTPTLKPAGNLSGFMRQAVGMLTGAAGPTLATGPATVGGILPPAMGPTPAQPAAPAQPAYTPPPVPAYQTPDQQLGLESFYPMMEKRLAALGAAQGYAGGGDVYSLGGYSDGGRLLKGPGDGVSDSIPAVIGQRQPARLADGEFVVPARIVSEIGNGSTEAGARKLYAMMDRVQKARGKTVGKKKVAVNTRSEKYLPA